MDVLIRKQNELGDENSKAIRTMNANIASHKAQYDGLGNAITGVKNRVITAFGISEIKEAIGKIFDLTATYQKYTAALTVGLGDAKKAGEALDMLQSYADKTNFTLDELADTFTKLANRGLVVSREEMVKLGDVANALQKPFGDLVEAILDINNTERWNELGIKAKTAGEKVQLTFKGVTLEVDRTEKGVLSAITAFGTLNGVQGQTAAQALTLAGRYSTLQDSTAGLGRTVGTALTPAFEAAISAAGDMIKVIGGSDTAFNRTVNYIKAAAAALTTYQVVVNATEIKTIALSAAMAAKEVVMKSYQIIVGTSQIAMQALSSAMTTNAAATTASTTATTAATTAARSFWAALAANPIGLIITAVGVATSAYHAWQAAHSEVNIEVDAATQKLIKEKVELENAVLAVQGYSIGTQERTKAIGLLMDKYPTLLGYVDAERVTNSMLNKALTEQIGLLDAKIRYSAAAAQADVVYEKQKAIYTEQIEIIIKLRGVYKQLSEAFPDNDKFVAEVEKAQKAEYNRAEALRNTTTAAMAASGSIVAFSGETAKYTELGKQATAMQTEAANAIIEVSKASTKSTNIQIDDINRQLASLEAAHKAKLVNEDTYKAKKEELGILLKKLNKEEDEEDEVKVKKILDRNTDKHKKIADAEKISAAEIQQIQLSTLEQTYEVRSKIIENNAKIEVDKVNESLAKHKLSHEAAAAAILAIEQKKTADLLAIKTEQDDRMAALMAKFHAIVVEANQQAGQEVIKIEEAKVKAILDGKLTEEEYERILLGKVTELRQQTADKVRKIDEDTARIIQETQQNHTEATHKILEQWIGNYSDIAGKSLAVFNQYTESLTAVETASGKVSVAQANLSALQTSGKASSEDLAKANKELAIAKDGEAKASLDASVANLSLVSTIMQVAEAIKDYITGETIKAYEAIIEAIGKAKEVIVDFYDVAIEANQEAMNIELENYQGSYDGRTKIMETHFARERELAERRDTIKAELEFQEKVITSTKDTTQKVSDAWDLSKGPIGPKALLAVFMAFKEHHAQVLAAAYEREAREQELRIQRTEAEIERNKKIRDDKLEKLQEELDAFVEAKEAEIKRLLKRPIRLWMV
ncbi:MAG: hypothetical protein R2822_08855 [Spirosomataceae bacterium]